MLFSFQILFNVQNKYIDHFYTQLRKVTKSSFTTKLSNLLTIEYLVIEY